LMAGAAGIEMTESKLIHEGNRAHFMTRRFDRGDNGEKIHLQSLCGIAHYDYNSPGAYSYEQAFQVMDRLHLDYPQKEQLFRRALFNVIARNQDDHTKNISFLMNRDGVWRLAPAYDLTYAFNPENRWTYRHQMLINGKAENFSVSDLIELAEYAGIKNGSEIISQVRNALDKWFDFADMAGLIKSRAERIAQGFRFPD
ncbi:MAG: HipA domain-containing protein, partial [Victivallaceae bacterium]|nr:HipA domain-containing protein [Victivallaceae bacterium]